jgi:hypothetical protein
MPLDCRGHGGRPGGPVKTRDEAHVQRTPGRFPREAARAGTSLARTRRPVSLLSLAGLTRQSSPSAGIVWITGSRPAMTRVTPAMTRTEGDGSSSGGRKTSDEPHVQRDIQRGGDPPARPAALGAASCILGLFTMSKNVSHTRRGGECFRESQEYSPSSGSVQGKRRDAKR